MEQKAKESSKTTLCVVDEVVDICRELKLEIDTKKPDAENKYLSAWSKRITPVP